MPYAIKKSRMKGKKYCVYNKDTGRELGHTSSRAQAVKMIAAIHANSRE